MAIQPLLHRGAPLGWRRRVARGLLAMVLAPLLLTALYRFIPPAMTPLMLIRLAQGEGLSKDWVPLERMAPFLPRAVVAAEDNRFCGQALGFDLPALRAEIAGWWAGEAPRGASTVTMQTAKNLFLWPGRSVIRKAIEAGLTPPIALLWPKRRVMEVYLNVVEFGPGLYGAEAAAQAHFGKPAAELTRREASLLAAVLPSPLRWSAARPSGYVAERAAIIERRVGQLGPLLDCLDP